MRFAKHLAIAASTTFVLSVAPAYAQTTTYETTSKTDVHSESGYTANPPGPGAPTTNQVQPTRKEVLLVKRTAEEEIVRRAQISGADTQQANEDIAAGNRMLAENKLPEAQQYYKAAMSSVEDPHSMSMGSHATANNPNVTGTNGMQK